MDQLTEFHTITQVCDEILEDIQCDFVGLAFQNREGPNIRWHYAAGNTNDKYKRISVRYGKGIAGRVILTGRSMLVKNFPKEIIGKALEYPIMLAEKLLFAYAVPIHYKGIPKGVLLVGRRTETTITEKEQEKVQKAVVELEEMLNCLI